MKLLAPVFCAAALIACGGSEASKPPATQTLTGTFLLRDLQTGAPNSACEGDGGYSDIRNGARVTVKNESGTIIGTSALERGRVLQPSSERLPGCMFDFEVDGLPAAAFYAIEVSRRGDLEYSFDELEERRWRVELTLGN